MAWTSLVLGAFTALEVASGASGGGWGLRLILAAQWAVLLYWVRQLFRLLPGRPGPVEHPRVGGDAPAGDAY